MRLSLTCWAALSTLSLGAAGEAAAETPPNNATLAAEQAELGAVARREGRLVDACAHYARALELVPSWDAAHFEMARCLRLTGDVGARAQEHLRVALRAGSDRVGVQVERARQAEDRGDRAEARAAWGQVAALAPADVRPLSALPRVEDESGPLLERLRALARRQPMNLAAWNRLAEVAERAGRLDEAEEALRWVLVRSAHPSRAAAALGRFGQRRGRPEAVRTAREALAERPRLPVVTAPAGP